MIPIIGPVLNTAFQAFKVMTIAGTAGMGYGYGRKYGRIACEMMDQVEFRISERIDQQREELR
tara:strand:+ start:1062 stop:1250 length:189 start_codon:yes stop_codon:yes gene_type:complete